jgi:hypothetical protein
MKFDNATKPKRKSRGAKRRDLRCASRFSRISPLRSLRLSNDSMSARCNPEKVVPKGC